MVSFMYDNLTNNLHLKGKSLKFDVISLQTSIISWQHIVTQHLVELGYFTP